MRHICKESVPEDPASLGYAAAGSGFDFTQEGWSLPLDNEWNNGMVEFWNFGSNNGPPQAD
jgi:hypothetical protein